MSEHVRYAGPLRWDVCAACREPWPCPAAAAEQFAATKDFCEQQGAGRLPRVGVEITGEAQHMLWCGYAPQPGDPTCSRPATTHFTDEHWRGMTSCDQHAPIARAAGSIREHSTTGSACAMPEAMWIEGPPSRCVLDDSGVEPAPPTCPSCGHPWSWHDATRCAECGCTRETFQAVASRPGDSTSGGPA